MATGGEPQLLIVIHGTASDVENAAEKKVKDGLEKVKVSETDMTEVEKKLQGELFEKWHERCESMNAKRVPVAKLDEFLDRMQGAYVGIDEDMRKKMKVIDLTGEWDHKIYDFKQMTGENSGAYYGMIAFGKSAEGDYFDCVYVLYTVDFKVAPSHIKTPKKKSILWGLYKWCTEKERVVARDLDINTMKLVKNFFRCKALKGFYDEGLIDKINFVKSIKEIADAE